MWALVFGTAGYVCWIEATVLPLEWKQLRQPLKLDALRGRETALSVFGISYGKWASCRDVTGSLPCNNVFS